MEIEFQNTRQDYIDCFRINLNKRLWKLDFLAYLLLICLIYYGSTENYGLVGYLILLLVFVAFIFTLRYLAPLIITVIRFNHQFSKNDIYLQKRKITILDEGLRTEGKDYNLLRNWESIISSYSDQKFLYISLIDNKNVKIPKRFFTSEVEVANFIGLIQSHVSKKRYGENQVFDGPKYAPGSDLRQTIIKPDRRPPYLLGLLGFIPLVGAFVGVGLILYGIFQYKDKWLTIIGAACIAFTIFVYSSLFYSSKNNKVFQNGFANISQMQLNSLVKEIEFYKLENRVYPDSLQQLGLKDSFTNITDPLLNGKKNGIYNYHRIGNKYTLFSSGIDQIPNTADDIYPSIKVDTSKIGLIFKENKK